MEKYNLEYDEIPYDIYDFSVLVVEADGDLIILHEGWGTITIYSNYQNGYFKSIDTQYNAEGVSTWSSVFTYMLDVKEVTILKKMNYDDLKIDISIKIDY